MIIILIVPVLLIAGKRKPKQQESYPIRFLNNTCTLNIDTTLDNNYHYADALQYKFVSIRPRVHFSTGVTKSFDSVESKDTNILFLGLYDFFNYKNRRPSQDTSMSITIPFSYNGETFYKTLTCSLTFGKNKLVECDNPLILANDVVSKFFFDDNDTMIKQIIIESGGTCFFINDSDNIMFSKELNMAHTIYYSIKNITNKPIWVPKKLDWYHDNSTSVNLHRTNFIQISPQTTYKMPIQVRLSGRYRFNSSVFFLIFSENISEVYKVTIKSDFKPGGKYIEK